VTAVLTGLLCCVQDVKGGGAIALELVKALTACIVAGAQDQATVLAVGKALSCDDGIMGPYYAFLAVARDVAVSRSGRATFEQTPLLTVLTALQSLASVTNGARSVKARMQRSGRADECFRNWILYGGFSVTEGPLLLCSNALLEACQAAHH